MDEMIRNYGYICKIIAKKYTFGTAEYEDLYQEAMIGLIHAIHGYDESYGVKFETYATKCIKNAVLKYLNDKSIPLPPLEDVTYYDEGFALVENAMAIKQALKNFTKQERDFIKFRYYEDKTQVEIAELLGVSQPTVVRMEKRILSNLKGMLE